MSEGERRKEGGMRNRGRMDERGWISRPLGPKASFGPVMVPGILAKPHLVVW